MALEQNLSECDENLDEVDQRIVKFLVESPAISDREMAEHLGVSRQTINRRRNSTVVKQRLFDLLSISEKRIRRISAKALSRLEDCLDHEDPRIRLAASIAIARFGFTLFTPTPSAFSEIDLKDKKLWLEDVT